MPAQSDAGEVDTPFARFRARLDAQESDEAPPGPVAQAIARQKDRIGNALGPVARVPFTVWVFGALFLGIGAGTLAPQLIFAGDWVLTAFGYIAAAAPMIIFFTLTPALVRMYATASAGKFALYVVVGFILTTTFGGLFALLVSLVFFPGMTLGFGATGVLEQIREVGATSVVLLIHSPLFRAIWGALVISVVLYFGGRYGKSVPKNPIGRMLRSIMDLYVIIGVHGVSALGQVIKVVMPALLFLIGIFLVTTVPIGLDAELAEVGHIDEPPWTPLQAYFISVGVVIVITLLWLAFVSFALSAYTRFPLKRLIARYLLVVYPFAWATSSSAASIPINIASARDGLGVRPEVRSFVIPIGATVNLDGTMMAAVVGTVVASAMVGYQISVLDFMIAMIPLILITIGTPGVPGGLALIAGPVMWAVLPVPVPEALFVGLFAALLFGPNDMFRTAVNVLDNGMFALLLDKWWPERFVPGAEVNPWLPVGEGAPALSSAGHDAHPSSTVVMGEGGGKD